MIELSIDIETFSSVNLKTKGVYRYAASPDLEILMLTYRYAGEEYVTIDLASGQELPQSLLDDLSNPEILKTAHNAEFEITCLSAWLGYELDASQWCCTMVKCSMLGLPMSLDEVSKVLKLEQEKDSRGKKLIGIFSVPCKPSKTNGQRTRNLPEHFPEDWQLYLSYNRQDVVVECAIREKISFFKVPEMERRLWAHAIELNRRGVQIDIPFVKKAIEIRNIYQAKLLQRAAELTGVKNPKSNKQLLAWINEETEEEFTSLNKTEIPKILEKVDNRKVLELIELRSQYSKSSLSKYDKMLELADDFGRVRGIIQIYGAGRTGRYSGKFLQPQNFTKNHNIKNLDLAREIILKGDVDFFEFMYGNVLGSLSEVIRTALVAGNGYVLEASDLAAIEARVIAWLSGEQWVLDAFEAGLDIYKVTASRMFDILFEELTDEDRSKGKVSVLALGYQGAIGAMITMGAIRMGLCDTELVIAKQEFIDGVTVQVKKKSGEYITKLKYEKWDDEAVAKAAAPVLLPLVKSYREANPSIVKYWYFLEEQVKECIRTRERQELTQGMYCYYKKGIMFIHLPSGRELAYYHARLEMVKNVKLNEAGEEIVTIKETIAYMGKDKTWKKIYTYGGKIAENITQAVARDVLATQMLRMWDKGARTVIHVHDEIVNETPKGKEDIKQMDATMSQPISWAPGLPLAAKGFVSPYYKKD